jgi:hypothetical protein
MGFQGPLPFYLSVVGTEILRTGMGSGCPVGDSPRTQEMLNSVELWARIAKTNSRARG